jgi:hypothetical protein
MPLWRLGRDDRDGAAEGGEDRVAGLGHAAADLGQQTDGVPIAAPACALI